MILGIWFLAPVVREKLNRSEWDNPGTEAKSLPSTPAPTSPPVASVSKPIATPGPKPSPKSRAIAKKSSTPEPEVRKAVPVAKPSAKFLPAPTPVVLDWQGRPWVDRHASSLEPSNPPQESLSRDAPTASKMDVEVPSKRWSKLVHVPPDQRAFVTFTVGRMRVEADGIDRGIFFRQPTVALKRNTPHVWEGSIRPFATFDKTPGLLEFGKGTRTLRFLSLEKGEETVSVEFRTASE